MGEPYEIIMSPFEVYLAPVSTAFPAINATPASPWVKLGTSGLDNMDEEGVTVSHEQSITQKRTLGSTGPAKVARTEENLTISFSLVDLTLEQYAKALNGVTVSDVAAGADTAGYRSITLRQGRSVSTYALLVRGLSPYGDGYNAQYQVPVCYQSDNPAPVFSKGDAAALKFTFTAIEDPNAATEAARFGTLVAQDAAPV